MGTFGLCFYGPYQNWWYALLARALPGTGIPAFATKASAGLGCLGGRLGARRAVPAAQG